TVPGSVEFDEHQFVLTNERIEGIRGESDHLLGRGLIVGVHTGLNPVDDSLFISASVVVDGFSALLPELESGISLDVVSLANLSFHRAVNLCEGSAQLVGCLLVLRGEILAVATPRGVELDEHGRVLLEEGIEVGISEDDDPLVLQPFKFLLFRSRSRKDETGSDHQWEEGQPHLQI
ncbi:hypothetical protein PMAYCL1PPCAC_12809, partial [Pristionchus mayeri]